MTESQDAERELAQAKAMIERLRRDIRDLPASDAISREPRINDL